MPQRARFDVPETALDWLALAILISCAVQLLTWLRPRSLTYPFITLAVVATVIDGAAIIRGLFEVEGITHGLLRASLAISILICVEWAARSSQ